MANLVTNVETRDRSIGRLISWRYLVIPQPPFLHFIYLHLPSKKLKATFTPNFKTRPKIC